MSQLVGQYDDTDVVPDVRSKVHHADNARVEAGSVPIHRVSLVADTSRPVCKQEIVNSDISTLSKSIII